MSTTSTITIQARVPQEWEPRLQQLCRERGIELDPPRGRAGGISLLVRQLLGEAIGAQVIDPHEEQSASFAKRKR